MTQFRFLALAASITLFSCCAEAPSVSTLKFSAIPDHDATALRAKYEPFAKYLTEKLGVQVEYVASTDYAASVAMFINDEIQFAWFGGLTGVQAREKVPGAQAVAMGKKDAEFKNYFIASKNSEIQAGSEFPKSAAGKKFTFGSESSTSGRLMPEYFIRDATGKSPGDFFGQVNFSGSHDKTIDLVSKGVWEIGAVNFVTYDKQVAAGKLKKEDCPVVWTTPKYANYQFTVRPKLDERFGEGFSAKLTKTLIEMNPEMAAGFARESMIPAKNADFEGILVVAKQLGMIR
jgi:phosphonate transport system substrate-binding protein